MALTFRRGDPAQPRGHAIVYFESSDGRVVATYLVVAPITMDLAKYMPPMFAAHMPSLPRQEATAVPLPPVPEEVEGGLAEVERLAELRNDDLLAGGAVDPSQIDRLLIRTTELAQEYARAHQSWLASAPAVESSVASGEDLDVDEVLLSLMGDHDRVSELAKRIGKLRYAVDTHDAGLIHDAVSEMERVGRYLGDKYRVSDLIQAARTAGARGARLAELHVERCYKLAAEDYVAVGRVEAEIRRVGTENESGDPDGGGIRRDGS